MDNPQSPTSPLTPLTPLTPSRQSVQPSKASAPASTSKPQQSSYTTKQDKIKLVLGPNSSRITKRAHARSQSRSSQSSNGTASGSLSKASHVHPAFPRVIEYLKSEIHALESVTTNEVHPLFPRSILQYLLLTHRQLDKLALYYHQTIPVSEEDGPRLHPTTQQDLSLLYPMPMGDGAWVYADPEAPLGWEESSGSGRTLYTRPLDLATKRRRFGRFCGMKGCESPVEQDHHLGLEYGTIGSGSNNSHLASVQSVVAKAQESLDRINEEEDEQQRLMDEEFDKEFHRLMQRQRDEEEAQEKFWKLR